MKKTIFTFLSIFWITINLFAQEPEFEWAVGLGGMYDDHGYSISVDKDGYVYSTGIFRGTTDFDPGIGIFNLTTNGNADIFVLKLDATGSFVWAKALGGCRSEYSYALDVDVVGNVYITGHFEETADFDPGIGTYNLISNGNDDVFVLKLDSNGDFVWAKSMGGISKDIGMAIVADIAGNVYTTGKFFDTADFNPSEETYNLLSSGGYDIFISKLDHYGNFLWAKAMGGSSYDFGYSIDVDSKGNVLTTGFFTDSVDFNPGNETFYLNYSGCQDIFISKLNPEGSFEWAKAIGGSSYDFGYSIDVDSEDNIYTTGYFYDTVDFDPGYGTYFMNSNGVHDIFVLKLDYYGNFSWAKKIGGSLAEYGYSLSIDNSEHIYITGLFQNEVDFDPGSGIYYLSSNGYENIFILKLNPLGEFVWAQAIGGYQFDRSWDIFIDVPGNVYLTGYYIDSVDFNPGNGIFNLSSIGERDVFILKLSQEPAVITEIKNNANLKAYPNPLCNEVRIDYSLDKNSEIQINIYNYRGSLVRLLEIGEKLAGNHSAFWDGTNSTGTKCATGIYIIKFETDETMHYQKVSLIE